MDSSMVGGHYNSFRSALVHSTSWLDRDRRDLISLKCKTLDRDIVELAGEGLNCTLVEVAAGYTHVELSPVSHELDAPQYPFADLQLEFDPGGVSKFISGHLKARAICGSELQSYLT